MMMHGAYSVKYLDESHGLKIPFGMKCSNQLTPQCDVFLEIWAFSLFDYEIFCFREV